MHPSEMKHYVPRPGRPSAAQVAAINQAILDAAAKHFLTHGYDGTSMDAVAAEAGVSKGTLYARYAQKHALLQAFIQHRVDAWSAIVSPEHFGESDTLEDRLKYIAQTVLLWGASVEIRAVDRLLNGMTDAPQDVQKAIYRLGFSRLVTIFEREIKECSARDGVEIQDARLAACLLMAALKGWFSAENSWRVVPEDEIIAFTHRAVDVFVGGRQAW